MSNITVTNNSFAGVVIANPEYLNDKLFTAAGAATHPVGMLLALNTSTSKYVIYVSGGATGTGVPSAILMEEIITTGAGDTTFAPMISGTVRRGKIGVSVALTAISDIEFLALQDYGIIAQPTSQLLELDNQ